MIVTILGKKFELPDSITDKGWVGMSPDKRNDRIIDYLQLLYPEDFTKRPSLDAQETPAGMIDMKDPPPSYVAQQEWKDNNSFAHKLYTLGKKRSLPEGLLLGHGGEAEAAIRAIAGGDFPFIGDKFRTSYTDSLRDIDLSYRMFERLYPVEALVGEGIGSIGIGPAYGGAKLLTQAPKVKKAWGTLEGGEKWKRILKTLGLGSASGTAVVGTYRHGKGEGGPIGTTEGTGTDRLSRAFLGTADDPWWAKPYTLGPAVGVGAPAAFSLVGKTIKGITGTPSNQLTREATSATKDAVTSGWKASADLRRQGAPASEIDEFGELATGLPVSLDRAARGDLLTLGEGTTVPFIPRGQTTAEPIVPKAFQREALWGVKKDPTLADARLQALQTRTRGAEGRVTDELYDASLGAERDAGEFLQTLSNDLEKIYASNYGKAYLKRDMPNAGEGGFRDILRQAIDAEGTSSSLAVAYNEARALINSAIAQRRLGLDVSIRNIPSGDIKAMPSLKDFTKTDVPRTIPVYQAHMVEQIAGENIAALRATESAMKKKDLLSKDRWIGLWNKNIDRHTSEYGVARTAYREQMIYKDALQDGRNIQGLTPAEVKKAYNTAAKSPEGVSAAEADRIKAQARKMFVSGAIERADLRNLDSLAPLLKRDELMKVQARIHAETRMAEYEGSLRATSGQTAQELSKESGSLFEQASTMAPALAFSVPFAMSRWATNVGKMSRLLRDQKIADEVQMMTMSTEEVTKGQMLNRMKQYARQNLLAEDRTIINQMIRVLSIPEVEEGFPKSRLARGLIQ